MLRIIVDAAFIYVFIGSCLWVIADGVTPMHAAARGHFGDRPIPKLTFALAMLRAILCWPKVAMVFLVVIARALFGGIR